MHDNVRMQVLLCEALEDIHKGRELIWDYGEGYWKQLQILEMMSPSPGPPGRSSARSTSNTHSGRPR